MELIPCNTCGQNRFRPIFTKESPLGESFSIVSCEFCGLVQVNPQPGFLEVKKYYDDTYFTQRTERGYDNYYSEKLRKEIARVFQLNLNDLDFFSWEMDRLKEKLPGEKLSSLDIGCAAGYFVSYLKARGYDAYGIEIADGPVRFARETLNLNIFQENFLDWDTKFQKQFDVITLWATIEHLHKPKETLEKIKSHLKPGGVLILSTCRYGFLAKLAGLKWRYLNVPEHLYYYSYQGLKKLLLDLGFHKPVSFTYGSGMTSRPGAHFFFKLRKWIMDRLVKWFQLGDMMVYMVKK
ncbi:class I SAM-dependent methyltransferase [Leptospira sp. 2 VSF19]|uniref:Class I SAM-dependent methyltransferase n=1 Tax=Leptospira soteropolitanensis TaxID=2950025 RepID=A0AAW5VHA2_9LEPT|nr:class I SAM-dependent methyltransferase [Leptospira soteropolitanensis]MCW7493001.1 class I SAM-dependent methyltransferase [Leptospira soteropolitanensis]MCW7500236.1 class I SAM-dependent methyltransferase [Leptospira soteropolitanensis]MCW7522487.1 class I SAM-dependent methyltransferase [Leptospira soteropolitanensis]MCW7526343.1 class I SAM-dependent methyltransferase [Leptospira soteropolitanensis]MCW7529545.1 class I SAM-dependent methyltransferase [Leptospira soteropolitanensis]